MKIPQRVLDQIDYEKQRIFQTSIYHKETWKLSGVVQAQVDWARGVWFNTIFQICLSRLDRHSQPVTELHYGMGEQR